MKKVYFLGVYLCLLSSVINTEGQCIVDYRDVRVVPSSTQQSEVNISINPNDPDNLILSYNADNYPIEDEQGYANSIDGGNTWFGSDYLQNVLSTVGDPMTAFDANGIAYISGLNYDFPSRTVSGIFLQSSTNKGESWNNFIPPDTW